LHECGRTVLGVSKVTYTPFRATNQWYQMLYAKTSQYCLINYQAYADGLTTVAQYLTLYTNLAQEYGGYGQLGLGIASSTTAPRGLQPPDIYDVWNSLAGNGVQNVAIWCLEDSYPSFPIETYILGQPIVGGPQQFPAPGQQYTILPGDTLYSIATAAYGAANADQGVTAIEAANPGIDPNKLQPGQNINIPVLT
jgi:LysM repeat protein